MVKGEVGVEDDAVGFGLKPEIVHLVPGAQHDQRQFPLSRSGLPKQVHHRVIAGEHGRRGIKVEVTPIRPLEVPGR